jgi:hypothetical protein
MRTVALSAIACCMLAAAPYPSRAQDPPPPIGPFVVDVHGNVPMFGAESALAPSRGLSANELPGTGLGLDVAAHLYPVRWRAVTFGVGGRLFAGRARSGPSEGGLPAQRGVTERFLAGAPELSFNFGTGNGWSYISGGLGLATWSIIADGSEPAPADLERLRIVHYGAGARWFAKTHLAFAVDVRFYQNQPGASQLDLPPTPRSSHMVLGAGISLK